MTDQNELDEGAVQESELDALKSRAATMGITFHPNIGLDTLRAKVQKALEGADDKDADSESVPATAAVKAPAGETIAQRNYRIKQLATELIRVEVTCMNPQKKEWEGEIFTASNSAIGTVKLMVPFNTPWHVPRIIVTMMEERRCQVFYTVKDSKGNKTRRGKLITEFAINKLPKLTDAQIKELAQRQAMANGTAE